MPEGTKSPMTGSEADAPLVGTAHRQFMDTFTVTIPAGITEKRTTETASNYSLYALTPGTYPLVKQYVDASRFWWTAKLPATLLEEYVVNRLFTASSVNHTFPNTPEVIGGSFRPNEVSDGAALRYGNGTVTFAAKDE